MAFPQCSTGEKLYFDEDYDDGREAIGALACGFALRQLGLCDVPETRLALAKALRTLITHSGQVEEARSEQPLLH